MSKRDELKEFWADFLWDVKHYPGQISDEVWKKAGARTTDPNDDPAFVFASGDKSFVAACDEWRRTLPLYADRGLALHGYQVEDAREQQSIDPLQHCFDIVEAAGGFEGKLAGVLGEPEVEVVEPSESAIREWMLDVRYARVAEGRETWKRGDPILEFSGDVLVPSYETKDVRPDKPHATEEEILSKSLGTRSYCVGMYREFRETTPRRPLKTISAHPFSGEPIRNGEVVSSDDPRLIVDPTHHAYVHRSAKDRVVDNLLTKRPIPMKSILLAFSILFAVAFGQFGDPLGLRGDHVPAAELAIVTMVTNGVEPAIAAQIANRANDLNHADLLSSLVLAGVGPTEALDAVQVFAGEIVVPITPTATIDTAEVIRALEAILYSDPNLNLTR